MRTETFKHRDFTIEVNTNCIKIIKDTSIGRLHANLVYDRKLKTGTFSGQFPWVQRNGLVHRLFIEVVELIGTSTKVTKVKTHSVITILDSINI